MAHCPDFSDSDSDFSDDLEYHDFKEKIKQINRKPDTPRILSEQEKRDQQHKALFSALSSGNVEVVLELLNNGLNVNVDIQDGWTPLLLASSFGNPELTEALIQKGADLTLRRDGCTALMMACNCPKNTSPFTKSLKVIKQLVEKGADVKTINRKRMTALMFAANTGNLDAVKYLLPLSNKDAQDNQKWTALFWAVNNNEVGVVKYLLDEGLDCNIIDVRNNTPFDLAKNNDFHEIIELFPKEEPDILGSIIDSHICSFEETFANPKEKPKFFLDICNILCGVRNESVIKVLADKDIGLYDFLSISDDQLKELGVKLPYQRNRILGGLYRFHKHPFHPKSLHVVPLNETYSNIDMATQLLSSIKQVIAMEASLVYIMKNYRDEDVSKENLDLMAKNVKNIKNKIRLCKIIATRLRDKTRMLDSQVKPVDLITKNSRKYKIPWRKMVFSLSVVSLILVFRIFK